MPAYFSAERVEQLLAEQEEVHRHFADLRDNMCMRTYKTGRGAEYARHGFCRRLETLVRSIDRVYELLPPDQEQIPERNTVVDAAIAIQAFTMNAFGCLDNIAWIWVYEKGIKNSDGSELDQKDVGLGKKKVRNALTKEFQAGTNWHRASCAILTFSYSTGSLFAGSSHLALSNSLYLSIFAFGTT
jgi:hypothetical protein